MQTITFECEVITPMFLAGADGTTPELRAPSIKGALRFWWRAMNGGLVGENGDLSALKQREAEIFGGSGKEEGRSKVIIRVVSPFPNSSNNPLPNHRVETYNKKYKINILDYLAFGPVQYDKNAPPPNKNVLTRDYIGMGEKFYVKFDIVDDYEIEVLKAFALLEAFGGLGTKSHNGFGCFKILNEERLQSINFNELAVNTKKSFSSFSQFSKIYETNHFPSWNTALAEIGDIYQNSRENVENHYHYDKRVLIAHPIIVNKNEVKETILKDGRHAKPYFLHVTKLGDKKFYGQIISMPYQFLKGHPSYSQNLENKYIKAIDDFDAKIRF